MEEYLGFVDEIGRTVDGKYIYRFDFTVDKETIWGDFFNVAPSAIVPNLMPDKNSLSRSGKAVFPRELVLAKKNYCFSMQDCIDGIIPLCFCEIDNYTIEYDNKPFFLNFGDDFEHVDKLLKTIGCELFELKEIEKGDDSAIDDLIDSMDEDEDNDDDENF